jgi:alkylhydroperoxidase family enzyme
MKNPALVLPDALQAIKALYSTIYKGGVPLATLERDGGTRHARKSDESDERLFAVAAWRDAPFFSDAERAALALTEAVTRLNDRPDPVPDQVWQEAARPCDERALAALILAIATTNVFNRLNVTTRQVAGTEMPWN